MVGGRASPARNGPEGLPEISPGREPGVCAHRDYAPEGRYNSHAHESFRRPAECYRCSLHSKPRKFLRAAYIYSSSAPRRLCGNFPFGCAAAAPCRFEHLFSRQRLRGRQTS